MRKDQENFNIDETGLFFTKKKIQFKGEKCVGCNLSKGKIDC